MSFSAKMMNLGMRKVYDYLEKDPKTNLPKLMEMIDPQKKETAIWCFLLLYQPEP